MYMCAFVCLNGERGGGVCMCAWDSVYVWREMGGGGMYVCM